MDYVLQPTLWPEFSNKNNNMPVYAENDCQPYKHEFTSQTFSVLIKEALHFHSKTPLITLPPSVFSGGGIYALYYQPKDNAFGPYSKLCVKTPIYVGKAVNPGWRTSRTKTQDTQPLYKRLREHASSISSTNLDVNHFVCQFTILKDIDLIVPVEAEMIRTYSPLWNTVVDGFGNHDPGNGRRNQAKSFWDILHPGRNWANKCKGVSSKTKEDILSEIANFSFQQSLLEEKDEVN